MIKFNEIRLVEPGDVRKQLSVVISPQVELSTLWMKN